MKTNINIVNRIYTHEGAPAKTINAEQQLRRSLMACLLWEDTFYESGEDIASRIKTLVHQVDIGKVGILAIEAREKMKLRHVPLLVVREMARHPKLTSSVGGIVERTLFNVIQRADEITEFVSLYWKEKRQPLSKQVKRGLARSFTKFNEYQLAKYNLDEPIKLRDVLFLVHAKPENKEQAELWKKLVDGKLEIPDTWEVNLSAGKNKKETWERLLTEKKLGGLALLRNLRNMEQVKVNEELIFDALNQMKTDRILPYRFIAAARYSPQWESKIEIPMLKCLEEREKLSGKTIILVDVSGSMGDKLSGKSDLTRLDAACGLAILARELCEQVIIITFSNDVKVIPDRHGFALRDAIVSSQTHAGTELGKATGAINAKLDFDRIIVITDEQSHDKVPAPKSDGYMINVAAYQNGVGYGAWNHIDGWSESVFDYIIAVDNAKKETTGHTEENQG